MQNLDMFGFPVGFDAQEQKLLAAAGVSFEDYSRKYSKGMFGLLADKSYNKEDEPYYDFYKAIGRDADRTAFEAVGLRYDSTAIMAGCAGDEFKKTAGHFHCQAPGHGMSYPEYYQVIRGTALFVMQKVADSQAEGTMTVEDALLAVVHEGQAVVVPPDYGHCTVNIGAGTLVFVNLVSCDSHNDYDGVKRSAGMCCYVKRNEDGGYRIEKNPAYAFSCEPKLVTPLDNDALGLHQGVPVYTAFLQEPGRFAYLNIPERNSQDYLRAFQEI